MHRNSLRFAGSAEDGTLCVLTLLPEMLPDDVPISCMAIPILSRPGGMLLAVPAGYISPHVLLDAAFADETTLLGPSQEFKCFMIEEDEHGGEHRLDEAGSFLAIDVSDAILAHLREYDPVTDPSETIQTFVPEHPEAIVDLKQAFEDVRAWLETLGDSARVNFFSAREEPPQPLPKTGKGQPEEDHHSSSGQKCSQFDHADADLSRPTGSIAQAFQSQCHSCARAAQWRHDHCIKGPRRFCGAQQPNSGWTYGWTYEPCQSDRSPSKNQATCPCKGHRACFARHRRTFRAVAGRGSKCCDKSSNAAVSSDNLFSCSHSSRRRSCDRPPGVPKFRAYLEYSRRC